MSKRALILIVALVAGLFVASVPAAADRADSRIHLRRATFDPLREQPAIASGLHGSTRSRLLLVQLGAAPGPRTRATLEASGLRPLLYIPDNAYLVRMAGPARPSVAAVPGARWIGPFLLAYKLPSELDQLLAASAGTADLRLLAARDADADALARDLESLGGQVLGRNPGVNGTSLRVLLPIAALRGVLERDDVLWVERHVVPQLFNDRARRITGVTAARQEFGSLDGSGQIVAVTDTGLDIQSDVEANDNPDFAANRIAQGFTTRQMRASCLTNDWSDRNGHGTHVAGTVLGSGARSPDSLSFAGIAPGARLVVQAVSSGGSSLDCLPNDNSYLDKAYMAGARVQNGSWGGQTGGSSNPFGGYDDFAQSVDSYLWEHKDHLFVVAAGNEGEDNDQDGVIDRDSINSPATAKNVLTVGATENDRTIGGACLFSAPESYCWPAYGYDNAPFDQDFISDNPDGMAAFSSRGPADDGRIKPEIVAPGVNIVSAGSHHASANYFDTFDANYAYESGTSMATPVVSGLAALVRQWLNQERDLTTPSAALVKALLLNGATNISPGQYGTGAQREIPAAWPNNVEGWGRAAMTETLGLGGSRRVWLRDRSAGVETDEVVSYTLNISAGMPLRVTLAWTDFPGAVLADPALVNNLDLEVQPPTGPVLRGNANAELPAGCRTGGADRCNNVESVEVAAPAAGAYIVRVRGAVVPEGPQPFALVVRAARVTDANPLGTATLNAINNGGASLLRLAWSSVADATFYELQESPDADFGSVTETRIVVGTSITLLKDVGVYHFRVRACDESDCGSFSTPQSATVVAPLRRVFGPVISK